MSPPKLDINAFLSLRMYAVIRNVILTYNQKVFNVRAVAAH